MSDYTKTTDFQVKDSLPSGDTGKIIKGAEFEVEFDAISTAIATKADLSGSTFTGTVTIPTVDINAGAIDGTTIGANSAAAGTFSDLTATTADINAGTIDNAVIGGSTAAAGTFTNLVATTADINGGTVDGATIGGSSAGAGTFTNLTASGTVNFNGATLSDLGTVTTADINGGTIDGVTIGGSSAGAGTFSSLTATTADINGGTADNVVIGGSTPAAGTFSSLTATTADINGGTIDGVSIGSSSTGAGAFSTLTVGGSSVLTSVAFSDINAGAVTLSSETFSDVDNQIPTNAAVIDYVAATIPLISEVNDLSAVVTWATVPDAYISASSVNQHVSVEKATQSKTYALNETSTLTLSSSISSGVPVVSVTKEIAQSGVTNNDWDVDSTAENYTRYNSAPATTLDFVFGIADSVFVDSFSVSAQETQPTGVAFNTDGTKMFIVGENSDAVQEYALSTGFDVSTASHTRNFSVSSQEGRPTGIAFNADGTKMFISGEDGQDVNEYAVSTGFDLSSVSYTRNFSVSSQDTDPRDVAFSTDGTKMFVLGRSNDTVFQYTLTTGFDLSTASYASKSFSITSQEDNPKCFAFNSDGTKMFILGWTNDTVFEYALSTAFDVSTASYSSVSFSVAAQEVSPDGLAFNNDGTKMFVCGQTGDDVNEYNLSPSTFSLGSGSFASADVGKTIEANGGTFVLTSTAGAFTQTSAPTSFNQVASGSWEMYGVVYNTTDGDLEVSNILVGTFDVSTASYSKTFSVHAQETGPTGMAFNTNGTKMFIVGDSGDEVNEYNLTTGFDISTASFSQNFSVSSQDSSPREVTFNTNGTKMFIVGRDGQDVNEYNLSTGFDVSTASYSQNFSVSSQENNPEGIAFNTDGTKMFIVGTTGQDVNEYNLSTGFNVSTASYSQNFSVSSQETQPQGIAFNTDGTKMFITGASGDDVNEYKLSTGFDVSTASYSQNFSVSSENTNPQGITFNTDGTKMFIVGSSGGNEVNEYDLGTFHAASGYHAAHTTTSTDSTYWTDINSMTADQAAGDGAVYYCVSTDDRTTWKIAKGTDGLRSIVRNNSGTWQFNSNGTYGSTTWANAATNTELAALQEAMEGASVTVGFDISTASYASKSFSVASQEGQPQGVRFNTDGTKMFVAGYDGDDVNEYTLSTAFDVSTASFVDSFSVSGQETLLRDLAFNNDGTKMFIVGQADNNVDEYDLTTGFDVSTASASQSFSLGATPCGITFNSDGTKMFITDASDNDVDEYALSTGFDVSTASLTQSFSVSSKTTSPFGIQFNSDGTEMFILGQSEDKVFKYTLTTAYDVSTASYASVEFAFTSQDTNPHGFTFNPDGSKMFMVGTTNDTVFQYNITTSTSYPNQMDKTQLDAVPDANHFTLGNDLDLAIIFNMSSGSTVPSSDGVSINFDANSINQGAVLGTDYNFDFPAANKVRITSLAAQNLKVRII